VVRVSQFGKRIDAANHIIDMEFGDLVTYTPMTDPVNGEPVIDADRAGLGGTVRAIIVAPGTMIGAGIGLAAGMHNRASEEPMLWYMAQGKLADVRKKDVVFVPIGKTFLDKPRRYEVADGPQPVGFGRYKVKLFELTLVAGDTA
jgi:hypothetical protein